MNKPISIFLFEDRPLFVSGFSQYLANEKEMSFVGAANTIEECEQKMKGKIGLVNILLMDVKIKENAWGGFDAATKVMQLFKHDGNDPIIVFLSGYSELAYIERARKMGCSFLNKYLDMRELIRLLKEIHSTKKHLYIGDDWSGGNQGGDVEAVRKTLQEKLTPKQGQTAINLGATKKNKAIAVKMNVDLYTVESHLKSCYLRLGLIGSEEDNKRDQLRAMIKDSGLSRYIDEINKNPENWFGKNKTR